MTNMVNPFNSDYEITPATSRFPSLASSNSHCSTLPQNGRTQNCDSVIHDSFIPDFTALDDSHSTPADDTIEGQHKLDATDKSSLRSSASFLGDSARKRAQKLKQSGTQRLKGTTSFRNGRLKSSNTERNDLNHNDDRDLLLSDGGQRDRCRSTSINLVPCSPYSGHFSDLESRSVQELENIAVQKSEETTSRLHNCLKIAEDIKGDATRTIITLHQQGEQIKRTHEMAVEMDQKLSTGEKILGSLGGIFSRTWKPKKSRAVTGPLVSRNDSFKRRGCHLEQRAALGLMRSNSKGRTQSSVPSAEPQIRTIQGKLDADKQKQDDALSDLSNVLDQLKEMSLDMGSEISSQNEALEHLQNDVVELGDRMKGANSRARRLLGK